MNEIEVNNFATDVLVQITRDLNNSLYSEIDEELVLRISENDIFGASAEIETTGSSKRHVIIFTYTLFQRLYKDACEFCNFVNNELSSEIFTPFFSYLDDAEMLPTTFTYTDNIKNIFLGAITWIYFHELGHLVQDHGSIRHIFGEESFNIQEFKTNDSESNLTGEQAIISHITELAADFYGVNYCLFELYRHWGKNPQLMADSIYMYVCGICCCYYRFYGHRSLLIEEEAKGSHPNPMIRMELSSQQIFETVDHIFRHLCSLDMDRRKIVHFYTRAITAVSLFWFHYYVENKNDIEAYIPKGIMQRSNLKIYFQELINAWDEIEPQIDKSYFNLNQFQMLFFSDQFRDFAKIEV